MKQHSILFSLFLSLPLFAVGMETLECSDPSGHIQFNGLGRFPEVRLSKIENGVFGYQSFRSGLIKVLETSKQQLIHELDGADCDELGRGIKWKEIKYSFDIRLYRKKRYGPLYNFDKKFIKSKNIGSKQEEQIVIEGHVECWRTFETPVLSNCHD